MTRRKSVLEELLGRLNRAEMVKTLNKNEVESPKNFAKPSTKKEVYLEDE